jgi:RNA-directed DNA polymerase
MPSKKKIQAARHKIEEIIDKYRHAPTHILIKQLNYFLRGWAEHYRTSCASKIFAELNKVVFDKLWKMLSTKHPNLPKRELVKKYFMQVGNKRWVFFAKVPVKDPNKTRKGYDIVTLFQITDVKILRHALIENLNYFLPENWEYFTHRRLYGVKSTVLFGDLRKSLALKQGGKCPVCDLFLSPGQELDVHHILPVKDGGMDTPNNLVLLHRDCHVTITHSKDPSKIATWLKRGIIKIPAR